ncbi:MAG: ABC transporter ATP-binding protein [Anaerolineales bacterium]|nr:ABC transporter ATP-binding protein [Anaerolineales bacterium]
MNPIEVEHLSRTFNGLKAVDDVSFSVREGEVFGFLGPNGAGKTTTINMLIGQLKPTSGRACIMGWDINAQKDKIKQHIGVVHEHQNLYERMSGQENLVFITRLHGVNPRRADQMLERVGLGEHAKKRIQHYSNGMKQRLLIARALLHQPQVLFLDEPTRGLDPSVAVEIRKLVKELAATGVTIFLTTHYMDEADQLCQRVAFINQGRIEALDTPEQLKVFHGSCTTVITLKDGHKHNLSLDTAEERQRLADWLAEDSILAMHSGEATLEEVFLKLTGRSLL